MKEAELRKLIKEEIKNVLNEKYDGDAVLPIGVTNFETGDNKSFNIYDTWNNKGYINVFKKLQPPQLSLDSTKLSDKLIGVISSGRGSGKHTMSHSQGEFFHNDTGRSLGKWKYIEEIPLKDKKKLVQKYKKLRLFVYK